MMPNVYAYLLQSLSLQDQALKWFHDDASKFKALIFGSVSSSAISVCRTTLTALSHFLPY